MIKWLALKIQSKLTNNFGMIGWMIRNIISRGANVLKIYKTLRRPHIENYTQAWVPVSRHGNWSIILTLEDIQRVTKLIKRVKDYSYGEKLEELEITTKQERRMRGDLIETFKLINGISNNSQLYFNYSPQNGNLLSSP